MFFFRCITKMQRYRPAFLFPSCFFFHSLLHQARSVFFYPEYLFTARTEALCVVSSLSLGILLLARNVFGNLNWIRIIYLFSLYHFFSLSVSVFLYLSFLSFSDSFALQLFRPLSQSLALPVSIPSFLKTFKVKKKTFLYKTFSKLFVTYFYSHFRCFCLS